MCATEGDTFLNVEISVSSWLNRVGAEVGKKGCVSAPQDCDSLAIRSPLVVQSRKSTPRSVKRCLISDMESMFKVSATGSLAYDRKVCLAQTLLLGATKALDVVKARERRKHGILTNMAADHVHRRLKI